MERYTIDDFGFESIIEESHGHWESRQRGLKKGWFVVNSSSIFTQLIRVAGRICGMHADDLFICWKPIDTALRDMSSHGGTYRGGFRADGVDNADYVLGRLNSSGREWSETRVKELYLLEIQVSRAKEQPDDMEICMYFGRAHLLEDMDGQEARYREQGTPVPGLPRLKGERHERLVCRSG